MDARLLRCAVLVAAFSSLGASYRTKNFVVSAPSPELAREIGDAAETFRHDLAEEWLGQAMPNWAQPCPITAQVGPQLGAGGATSFVFDHGEVFGWRMTIQGSRERILDSVLPHEVTHTIFATHFRQPLPRWADEGACTTVEHSSERAKQQHMLINFLRTRRGIAFSQMFAMKEYPRDVLPLYSQGYSLARYLIAQGGKRKFLNFLSDGLRQENWTGAVRSHYGFDSLATLQNRWLDWVRQGSPQLDATQSAGSLVAVQTPRPSARPAPSSDAMAATAPEQSASRSGAGPGPSAIGPNTPGIYQQAATSPEVLHAAGGGSWHPPGQGTGHGIGSGKAVVSTADARRSPQHQVIRPQPMDGPRQVILEWSRPPGAATTADSRTAPGGGAAMRRMN